MSQDDWLRLMQYMESEKRDEIEGERGVSKSVRAER